MLQHSDQGVVTWEWFMMLPGAVSCLRALSLSSTCLTRLYNELRDKLRGGTSSFELVWISSSETPF